METRQKVQKSYDYLATLYFGPMRDTQKFLYGIRLLIWYKSGAYLLPDAEPPLPKSKLNYSTVQEVRKHFQKIWEA